MCNLITWHVPGYFVNSFIWTCDEFIIQGLCYGFGLSMSFLCACFCMHGLLINTGIQLFKRLLLKSGIGLCREDLVGVVEVSILLLRLCIMGSVTMVRTGVH